MLLAAKFEPVTCKVRAGPPAVALVGKIEAIEGAEGGGGGGGGGGGENCVELPPPQLASPSNRTKNDAATMHVDLMTPSFFATVRIFVSPPDRPRLPNRALI